jgi:hypothetical protein
VYSSRDCTFPIHTVKLGIFLIITLSMNIKNAALKKLPPRREFLKPSETSEGKAIPVTGRGGP